MKISVLSLSLVLFTRSFIPSQVDKSMEQLIQNFISTDWPTVLNAKEEIENSGYSGIAGLMPLLNNCPRQKLLNTGDLIFPGAEKYYGHGQIIDYDIDDLCVRTGWLLEDLAFQNFGFSGIHLPDNELTNYIRFTFPGYYNNSTNRKQLETMPVEQMRNLIRDMGIANAKEWWIHTSGNWTRINALAEALESNDEKRQAKALFYLRNGKTRCPGLNKTYYEAHFENKVTELSKVNLDRISENAKLLLLDSNLDWLSIKPLD